ncbi:fimbrial protein [Enterobacter bugandensis]|uniref:fimbrial protein n=1 Tax=Enterobacter bugandensis TaxID=881260 RepID=UPI000B4A512D|nr:fimbrial protein [Enterobacter bugandensis]QWZ48822.1 fimbrial protein [Enterobacter bugandensis]UBH41107.1 fimbrial protein [Enterobacter bugandensis]UBH92794.1 fimbrial protein [Enterobacter bugandensis]UBH99418.1 fimbrial protein [Enterobacter bugandensis]
MKRLFIVLLTALPLAALSSDNMSFHGTLISPSCKINNGDKIEVDFGQDLGVSEIDGVNFKTKIDYNISCDSGFPESLAIVLDTSNPAVFMNSTLQTSKSELGIHVLVNGTDAMFGQKIAVDDPSSPPVVEVVPVGNPADTLTAGSFEATMTLRTDYM